MDSKKSIYWNKYEMVLNEKEERSNNCTCNIRKLLYSSFQGVKILFVPAYDNSGAR